MANDHITRGNMKRAYFCISPVWTKLTQQTDDKASASIPYISYNVSLAFGNIYIWFWFWPCVFFCPNIMTWKQWKVWGSQMCGWQAVVGGAAKSLSSLPVISRYLLLLQVISLYLLLLYKSHQILTFHRLTCFPRQTFWMWELQSSLYGLASAWNKQTSR